MYQPALIRCPIRQKVAKELNAERKALHARVYLYVRTRGGSEMVVISCAEYCCVARLRLRGVSNCAYMAVGIACERNVIYVRFSLGESMKLFRLAREYKSLDIVLDRIERSDAPQCFVHQPVQQ